MTMVQQNILIGAGVTVAAIALQKRQHAQVSARTCFENITLCYREGACEETYYSQCRMVNLYRKHAGSFSDL